MCYGWSNSNAKAGKSVIPHLSGEVVGWISQAQTQCLRVCNIPSLTAPLPQWDIPGNVSCLGNPGSCARLAPPDAAVPHCPGRATAVALRGGFGPSVPFASLQWELFQEQSVKGHTLFLFPFGPLWDQLPFHFCFIGLLKGCQLDIGKWGFSLLQSAGNKHHCGAI